ncbi:MAG: HAMP domain-containing histidine kinase [Lachnospiraceae bacterium]|nr:HAMP domain-containing histidine kinase [Lachnospiraceae bacterium]
MGLFKKKKEEVVWQEMPPFREEKHRKKGRFRRLRKERPWIFRGVAVSIVCAMIFSGFYGIFSARAEKYQDSPIEDTDNIAWLYQSCYLLYRDLYNVKGEESADYRDIYLEMKEGYQWLLDDQKRTEYRQLLSWMIEIPAVEEYLSQGELDPDWLKEAAAGGLLPGEMTEAYEAGGLLAEGWQDLGEDGSRYDLTENECDNFEYELATLQSFFLSLENTFRDLNVSYDYIIEDHSTGQYVTNMSEEDRLREPEQQYFLLSFRFDSAGNVTLGDMICGSDVSRIRKSANEVTRDNLHLAMLSDQLELLPEYGKIRRPVDCTVTFAVSKEAWESKKNNFYVGQITSGGSYSYRSYIYQAYGADAYWHSGLGSIVIFSILAVAFLGCFLPLPGGTKPWKDEKICSVSFEILFCFGTVLCAVMEYIISMIAWVASGEAGGVFTDYIGDVDFAAFLVVIFNLSVLTIYFFCGWYMGVCARALRELGLKEYVKQRSLIYRFFPFVKGKAVKAYESVAHMDLTENANRTIIKLLVVNAVILFGISCFWVGGFAITLVYSLVLYVILRKYISELQKRYRILLKAVDEIAEGHLNVTINEDLGVFEPFREQVFKIQDGLQKAVDMEVKSQRMKVELVTNMSHDLKTPLTAIITYINLLKEEGITEAQRREYLATLERKSLRLKSLIEDLFEFSKANSQNITLNIMDVDIMNLVKQVAFEMSDKLGEAGLDVRMNLTEEKVILPLDSQKTYRIYENLFGNIAKYALPGTRVYVNGFRIDDTVVITLKNISAQEITVDSSELTERFVRGDASRNTEGSGLGLAIAKSFTELQAGQLELDVDGDLFKVTTTWHIVAPDPYTQLPPFAL